MNRRINGIQLNTYAVFYIVLSPCLIGDVDVLSLVDHRPHGRVEIPSLPRTGSTEFEPLEDKQVEYFFASDASAIIEHTNRVIYFEVIIHN